MERHRIITRDAIKQMARASGVELPDQRADELVPQLQSLLEGLEEVQRMTAGSVIEPALIFRTRPEGMHDA